MERHVLTILGYTSIYFYKIIIDRYFRGFGIVFFIIVFWFGAAHVHIARGSADYWQHLSAIRALSSNIFDPPSLFLDTPYEVHLYTPYHVFWGAVAALGKLDPWAIASLASLANLLAFAWACRLTARYILFDSRLDFALMVTMVLFWWAPASWSGVYSAGQLTLQACYPSFLALGLTLALSAVYFEQGFRKPVWYALFCVGITSIFLIHPITSIFLLLFLTVKIVMAPGSWMRNGMEGAWAPIIGVAAGFHWPYFSVSTLVFGTASNAEFFGGFDVFYNNQLWQIWPAMLGLAALFFIRNSSNIRILFATLLLSFLIYSVNYIMELSSVLSRILIFITALLHMLIVSALAEVRGSRLASPFVSCFVIIASLGILSQAYISAKNYYGPYMDFTTRTSLGTHAASVQFRDIEQFGHEIGKGQSSAMVLAPLEWAYPVAALSGFNVVGVINDAPTMPEFQDRTDAVTQFYDATTSGDNRRDIIRRYSVDYILFENGAPPVTLDEEWVIVFSGRRFTFFAVKSE